MNEQIARSKTHLSQARGRKAEPAEIFLLKDQSVVKGNVKKCAMSSFGPNVDQDNLCNAYSNTLIHVVCGRIFVCVCLYTQ